MSVARNVISRFGGASALALATGWPRTTIAGWERGHGTIPPWRQRAILTAAEARGIAITAADFLPQGGAECVNLGPAETEKTGLSDALAPQPVEAA